MLRCVAEFGLDFQMAISMRTHLQTVLGFAQPPSLNQLTALSSELLVLALANVGIISPRHMREVFFFFFTIRKNL